MNRLLRPLAYLFVATVLAACGGGGGGGGDPFGGGGSGGGAATAAALGLASSATAVPSNNAEPVTVRASVLDKNNAAIQDVEVSFSSTAGKLTAPTAMTDDTGEAVVSFSSGDLDRSNQVATITAKVGSLSKKIQVQIIGTTLEMVTSKTSFASDGSDAGTVTITARDASTNGVGSATVCLQPVGSNGGALSFYSYTTTAAGDPTNGTPITTTCDAPDSTGNAMVTDAAGSLKVRVSGASAGDVQLIARALGTSASQNFTVSTPAEVFQIDSPAADPLPTLYVGQQQTVAVKAPGSSSVTFATSLGQWVQSGTSVATVSVGADGYARATLTSPIAGVADVLARDKDDGLRTDSVRVAFSADVSKAGKLLFSAARTNLPVSTGGATYSTTLTARVLTADDQPVAGAVVAFTALSATGGGESLSPPIAITDSGGEARTTFTSGSQGSSGNGIVLQATVLDTSLTRDLSVVITDEAGSVVVGASTHLVTSENNTTYSLPMTVLVADVNGNPVPNATVSLGAWPASYSFGVRDFINTNRIVNGSSVVTDTWPNEDVNENTILDGGEDYDRNGAITPPNSTAGILPGEVVTDENGVASFDLTYAKSYANWVTSRIRASTLVAGTELVSEVNLRLPATQDDIDELLLSDSPFNASCPFEVTVSTERVTVPVGGTNTVTLTLSDPLGQLPVGGRPVTALIDSEQTSGTLNALATGGVTNSAGRFTSTVSASALDAQEGDFATIYYYTSCTATIVRMVVGENTGTSGGLTLSAPDYLIPGNSGQVRVTLTDEAGVPLAGEEIVLSFVTNVTNGTLAANSGTTDSTGSFTTTYTAGANPGTDVIVATWLSAGLPAASANADIKVNMVGAIDVTAGASSVPVGGFPVAIRAAVTDTEGNAASGVPVNFTLTNGAGSFSGGGTTATATTNPSGIAEVQLLSGNLAGNATVAAEAGGFSDSVTVVYSAVSGSSLTLTAASTDVSPGGQTTIVASLTDASGNPVSGSTITFSFNNNASGAALTPLTGTTDSNGQVTTTYTAGDASSTAIDRISARSVTGLTSNTLNITVEPGSVVVGSIQATAGAASMVADGASRVRIRATVRDLNGDPARGVSVSFSTTLGTMYRAGTGTALGGGTVATDTNGIAEGDLQAGTFSGTATVTTSANGFTSSVAVELLPRSQSLALSTDKPTVNSDNSDFANVTASVLDGNNAGIEGVEVSFSADSGQLNKASAVTDAGGQASVVFSSGAIDKSNRTATITATIPGTSIQDRLPILIDGTTLEVSTDVANLTADGSVAATLTIKARDAGGNAIYNAPVCLTQTLRDPLTTSVDIDIPPEQTGTDPDCGGTVGLTNVSGNLAATVTGTSAGNVTVRAEALGTSGSQVFSVTDPTDTFRITSPEKSPVPSITVNATQAITVQAPNSDYVRFYASQGCWTGADALFDENLNQDLSPLPDVDEDANGNGVLDPGEDVDADGTLDLVDEDINGNGVLDTFGEDTDGDGVIDTEDTNGNGILDVGEDTNTNGVLDTEDTNGNGVLDCPFSVVAVDAVSGTAGNSITSGLAGTISITVSDHADPSLSDTMTLAVSNSVAQASRIIVQASPAVLKTSSGGNVYTSRVEARVLTVADQPVPGAAVQFTIVNPTGGGETLFPVIAYTGASGVATTTFTSGAVASSAAGVSVQGQVLGTALADTAAIILTKEAGSVVIGRSTEALSEGSATQYVLPMSVLVSDAAGNPVSGATVSLSAWPAQYQTGYWVVVAPGQCEPVITSKQFDNEDVNESLIRDTGDTVNLMDENEGQHVVGATLDPIHDMNGDGYAGEDVNNNGVLDPGEDTNFNGILDRWVDLNGNGRLDPAYDDGALTPPSSSAGTLPATVTTTANGTAVFDLTYLKSYSVWLKPRIRASVLVQGTESVGSVNFWLPYIADDQCQLPASPFNP